MYRSHASCREREHESDEEKSASAAPTSPELSASIEQPSVTYNARCGRIERSLRAAPAGHTNPKQRPRLALRRAPPGTYYSVGEFGIPPEAPSLVHCASLRWRDPGRRLATSHAPGAPTVPSAACDAGGCAEGQVRSGLLHGRSLGP